MKLTAKEVRTLAIKELDLIQQEAQSQMEEMGAIPEDLLEQPASPEMIEKVQSLMLRTIYFYSLTGHLIHLDDDELIEVPAGLIAAVEART